MCITASRGEMMWVGFCDQVIEEDPAFADEFAAGHRACATVLRRQNTVHYDMVLRSFKPTMAEAEAELIHLVDLVTQAHDLRRSELDEVLARVAKTKAAAADMVAEDRARIERWSA